MASVNTITVSGNLTADPELRKTSSEVPYARMRVAVSHRILDQETKTWEERVDGFFAVTAWRTLATHAATSLRKGDRVTVTGRLHRRQYEADVGDGQTETRYVHEIEAEDLGASLRWRPWTRLEPRPVNDLEQDGQGGPATKDSEQEKQTVAPAA